MENTMPSTRTALVTLALLMKSAAGSAAVRKRINSGFAIQKEQLSEFGRSLQIFPESLPVSSFSPPSSSFSPPSFSFSPPSESISNSMSMSLSMSYPVHFIGITETRPAEQQDDTPNDVAVDFAPPCNVIGCIFAPPGSFLKSGDLHHPQNTVAKKSTEVAEQPTTSTQSGQTVKSHTKNQKPATTSSSEAASLYERSCNSKAAGPDDQDTAVVPYAFEMEVSSGSTSLDEKINALLLDSVAEQVLDCFASGRGLRTFSLGGNTLVDKVNIKNEQDGTCVAESNDKDCIVKEGYVTITYTSDYPSTAADHLKEITTQIIRENIGALASLPGVARTTFLESPENLAPFGTSSSSANTDNDSSSSSSPTLYVISGFSAAVAVGSVFLFVYARVSNNRNRKNNDYETDEKDQVDDAATETSEEYGKLTEIAL